MIITVIKSVSLDRFGVGREGREEKEEEKKQVGVISTSAQRKHLVYASACAVIDESCETEMPVVMPLM